MLPLKTIQMTAETHLLFCKHLVTEHALVFYLPILSISLPPWEKQNNDKFQQMKPHQEIKAVQH